MFSWAARTHYTAPVLGPPPRYDTDMPAERVFILRERREAVSLEQIRDTT